MIHETTETSETTTGAEHPSPPPSPPPTREGGNRGSLWPTLFLALLLVVSASGITYLVATSPEDTATEQATDPGAGPETDPTGPETVAGSDEPVADAAERILPSVVQIRTGGGVGSGVVFDADGIILTAAHVVAGQETVTIRLEDGEQLEGTVLGGTIEADVAVVQVDRTGLPAAELAVGEEPRVGQMAVAVGSPWGLQGTVTAGIISAVDQTVPQASSARALLQTDAAINPGNSGGPLVDRQGRVVGINVSIFSLSGANDGVGFAVPIDIAYDVAQRILAGEEIQTPVLGVTLGVVESGRAGALVIGVAEDSGADEAGIQEGDLIISLEGTSIQDGADLAAQVRNHQPGETVEVVLVRDGEEIALEVTLGVRAEQS